MIRFEQACRRGRGTGDDGGMFAAAVRGTGSRARAGPAPLRSGIDAAGFDKAVRPQDDLYRYVNGAWLAKTEIPADRGAYGGFYEAIDRTQEQLRSDRRRRPSKSANKASGSAEQKLGDFFTAFMDEARANAARQHAARARAGAHRRPRRPRPTSPATWRG